MYTIKIMAGIVVALVFSTINALPVAAQHWVRIPSPAQGYSTGITFFSPQGVGYTSGDTILKTTDGGSSWVVYSDSVGGEIRASSASTGFYVPGIKSSRGLLRPFLYRSTDSGSTWQIDTNPQFQFTIDQGIQRWDARGQTVAIAEESNNRGATTGLSMLHISTDAGNTWETFDGYGYALSYCMSIIEPSTVLGAGITHGEWNATSESCRRLPGKYFPQSTVFGQKFMATGAWYVPTTGRLFATGGLYNTSLELRGLYVSKDTGGTFVPICYYLLFGIHFTPDGRYGAAVFANADSNRTWLLRTTNSGDTWGLQRIDNADNNINAVHLIDSANIFLVGYGGLILRTTDGGGPIIPIATLAVGGEGSTPGTVLETFLYPNPATARVRVRGADGQATTCTITDMMGRRVKELRFTGEQMVDVSEMSPGSYIVQCRCGNHTQVQQLMVVR